MSDSTAISRTPLDPALRHDVHALHAVIDEARDAMASAVRAGRAEPPPTCWGKKPARDWAIVLARYRDGRTLRSIGREFGISAQQIRIITFVTGRRWAAAHVPGWWPRWRVARAAYYGRWDGVDREHTP